MTKMHTEGVRFPMLADSGGTIGRMYGVYDEEATLDNRGTFVIDPDGVIQSFEVVSAGVGRNFDETIRQIKAFQHIRETQGAEALPVGWQPGTCTLSPRPELVGNVWKEWTPPASPGNMQ